ncbi:MAG TPA: Ku protein [Terriglobales bacterium]|jgi:DNA end-binding protein Ku|nr:Ku protein [Terriglobales bacterium]
MASSVWTGYLTFGLISMPVRLFSGARGTRVSFNMLHREDHARVKQQMICSEDGQVLTRDDVVKGYEFRKGEYVVIEPDDIKRIEPKTAKAMEILEFVPADQIDPIYFESSYYLMPEEAGRRPYALLVKALEESEYVAIAKLAMHNREYTVFLRPYKGGMLLETMYYKDEVREVEGFGETKDVQVKEAEVKVAHQLIEALSGDWDPEKYYDTFEANVKQLIKAKLEGKEVTAVERPAKPGKVVDLMAALKQSLDQMEKKKPRRVEASQAENVVQISGGGAKKKAGKRRTA